jgi:DNA-binding transcriptional regulator YhcF (GntR family)
VRDVVRVSGGHRSSPSTLTDGTPQHYQRHVSTTRYPFRTRSTASAAGREDVSSLALKDYLRASFYLGKISAGDKLPSHRELAKQLGISATAALDLYNALEVEGIIDARERSGTFLKHVVLEADCDPQHAAIFRALNNTVVQLQQLSVSPEDYTRKLQLLVGSDVRANFRFGFVMHREAFEIAAVTLRRKTRARLEIVALSPDNDDPCWARTMLDRDHSIRCVVATYLHINMAAALAAEFGRHAVMARPESSQDFFELPPSGNRYVLTRDRNTAQDIKSVAFKALGASQASRFIVCSLQDHEVLRQFDQEAEEILIAPATRAEAHARFGSSKRLRVLPSNLSDDTVDEIVFNYLFAR